MGRTKKRHRAWKQQMRARGKRKLEWYRNYGDISPGRLVAWAEWVDEREDRGNGNPKTVSKVQTL